MNKKFTDILLPFFFVSALGIILYFYYDSHKSVKQLIGSNEELLRRINYKSKFQFLQTHLATFDKLVREVVITKGAVEDEEIKNEIRLIDSTIAYIDDHLPPENAGELGRLLDSLVNLKIDDGITIHNEYVDKGKQQAELLVYYHNKTNTNERILKTINELEELSEQRVKSRIHEIDRDERNAMRSNIMIAIGASLFLLITLIYIYYKIKQQQRLIIELNASKEKEKISAKIKEDFLANISHEIRTPINAILGFTSLLEKEPLNEKAQKFVSTIKTSGGYLMHIVNEILDIAKIEEHMIQIEHFPFSLKKLLEHVESDFGERIHAKGLEFEANYPIDDMTIIGDEYRLSQILNNLLSNALKFTPSGKIKLHVSCKEKNDTTCILVFKVTDTGIGIPEDKIDKIFDRFEQGDTHITRKYGGTGLGLSIVKQLVDLQQGSIQLHSQINKGSEFIIELPFKLAPIDDLFKAASISNDYQFADADFHILIVEDNRINQQLLEHWFNAKHIQYKVAQNGFEALDLIASQVFDLILLDIQMPEMDGYEVTHIIRHKLNITIPIIAMTAHAMVTEKDKCLEAGMNDYISKPISEPLLFSLIQKHLPAARRSSFINKEYLLELSNGDAEFIRELLEQFMTQAKSELNLLLDAANKKDIKKVKSTAHSMITTFGYLGIPTDKLDELRALQSLQSTDEIQKSIDKISSLYDTLCLECKAMIDSYPTPEEAL